MHVGQQAELFFKTVGSFKGLLPPVVCLETHRTSLTEMDKTVKTFIELLNNSLGVRPVIYTSESYWKTYLPNSDWGCEYPLWLDNWQHVGFVGLLSGIIPIRELARYDSMG